MDEIFGESGDDEGDSQSPQIDNEDGSEESAVESDSREESGGEGADESEGETAGKSDGEPITASSEPELMDRERRESLSEGHSTSNVEVHSEEDSINFEFDVEDETQQSHVGSEDQADPDVMHQYSEIEHEGQDTDARSESQQSGAASETQQSDAKSEREQSDDVASERQKSDTESEGLHSDAEYEMQLSDVESERQNSDGEVEEQQSDAESENLQSKAESGKCQSETALEKQQFDREYGRQHSDAESDEEQSRAESDREYSDDGGHSDANSERHLSKNQDERCGYERDAKYFREDVQFPGRVVSDEEDSEHQDNEIEASGNEQHEQKQEESQKQLEEENVYPSEEESEHHSIIASLASKSDKEEQESDQEAGSVHSDAEITSSKRRKVLNSDEEENSELDSENEIHIKKKGRIENGESDEYSSDEVKPRKIIPNRRDSGTSEEEGTDEEVKQKRKRTFADELFEESDEEHVKRQKTESGSEDETGPPASSLKATAHDLFGEDAGDISSEEDDDQDKLDDIKRSGRHESGEGEMTENGDVKRHFSRSIIEKGEQEKEDLASETKIEVEIPRIVTNLGKEIQLVKLPNFLSVETRPYDPQWYEDEIDEDEVLDEEGRCRLKLKVGNTIRWRETIDADGNPRRESNARIVKWSDGSSSLHLGSEIFDVDHHVLKPGDHNHLFVRQGTGLQGQGAFRSKLTFRPHSTDSYTHQKFLIMSYDRKQTFQKIRLLPNVGEDPETHRAEMIKKEEDRLKASNRRESKQKRMKEKSQPRVLNASYLEPDQYEEEDEGAISLSAIKNKYKKRTAQKERLPIYSSDEISDEGEKEKKLEETKSADENNEDDDDSDLDYFDRKKGTSDGKKKTIALEESDEDS